MCLGHHAGPYTYRVYRLYEKQLDVYRVIYCVREFLKPLNHAPTALITTPYVAARRSSQETSRCIQYIVRRAKAKVSHYNYINSQPGRGVPSASQSIINIPVDPILIMQVYYSPVITETTPVTVNQPFILTGLISSYKWA